MTGAQHITSSWLSNKQIAAAFDETADLLQQQGANPFRVQAYRNAAGTLQDLRQPVAEILDEQGLEALVRLPTIGESLARGIEQLVRSGKLPLLERLRGEDAPERVFGTVPDIGPKLAKRIHEALGIETLSELHQALQDGRLSTVAGMGPKRLRAVRESLAARLYQRVAPPAPNPADIDEQSSVAELLSIDAEYRRLASQNRLPRIAPRRFNPTGRAWLPILHTARDARHYTAIYSNTARAHEAGTTHDWVVIYRDDGRQHGRWTVITSLFGTLRGRRIVRGRESECLVHYGLRKKKPDRQARFRFDAIQNDSLRGTNDASSKPAAPDYAI